MASEEWGERVDSIVLDNMLVKKQRRKKKKTYRTLVVSDKRL